MIKRNMQAELLAEAAAYPVVTLTGPRQSGKTTLVRAAFPGHTYCNLEQPEIRRIAQEDPKAFFKMYPPPVILEEIQRVPELLSWIQTMVDEDRRKGALILTGSHQLRLHEAVSQSLAGRTAMLRLLPLSLSELRRSGKTPDKESCLHKGFLPAIHAEGLNPTKAYSHYFQTYVERDVCQLIKVKSLIQFETFLRLLAGRVGQPVNLAGLSGEVGVSGTTLSEWLSILEASFIIYRLPPYHRNFGKRLVKSPKLYFVETGLAAWLIGIETPEQALRDPLHGNLFENMVVMDALKERLHIGAEPRLYYWRDNNGHEVDLLFEKQRQLVPVEIKSAMTWHSGFSNNLGWLVAHAEGVAPGFVVYAGEARPATDRFTAIHFSEISRIFE